MNKSLAILLALLILSSNIAYADNPKDHDQARQALESGQILPLRKILETIESHYSGQVLEIELDRQHGRWIYEIKMLQKDGLRIKLKVDAADGTVISDRRK